jgi:hypothetical protein
MKSRTQPTEGNTVPNMSELAAVCILLAVIYLVICIYID